MDVEDRLAVLEKKLHRTRLLLAALLVGVFLVGTMAANGPFVDLVCRSLAVKDAEGKTMLEVKETGEIKANGVDILAELESIKKAVKSNQDATNAKLDKYKEEVNGKLNDFVRVETFTFVPDYGDRNKNRIGRVVDASHPFNIKNAEWKLLGAFPTIQSPGYIKDIPGRSDWVAGATTVSKCEVVPHGDSFVLQYGARWYDWGEDDAYRIRIRFVAVFVRK